MSPKEAKSPKSKHVPQRMCTVCRKRADKGSLLRFVRTGEGIVLDKAFRMEGRGAYICRDLECISKAKTRHALQRSLKEEASKDLWTSVESLFR